MKRPPRYDLPRAAPGPLRAVQLFLNTTDHETSRELLGTPAAARAWFAEIGLETGPLGRAGLARAHAVRRELHELLERGVVGNGLAEAAERARLTLDLGAPRIAARGRGVDAALGTLLTLVYDAMRDGSWERLKACRNCGFAFWDGSRNRSAAWCSMQLCGNRLKVKRHRARRRTTPRSSR